MKNMVGELIMQFEEPTKKTHDKLIYWAFGKEGLIPQDLFDMAKLANSEILETVKFSRDQDINDSVIAVPPEEKIKKESIPKN